MVKEKVFNIYFRLFNYNYCQDGNITSNNLETVYFFFLDLLPSDESMCFNLCIMALRTKLQLPLFAWISVYRMNEINNNNNSNVSPSVQGHCWNVIGLMMSIFF